MALSNSGAHTSHARGALSSLRDIAPMPMSDHDLRGDQPALPLDPGVADAAATALEQGQTHYVDVPGIPQLREATARLLGAQGAACQSANIIVTAGLQEARFLTLQIVGDLTGPLVVPNVVHPGVELALDVRELAVQRVATDATRGMRIDLTSLEAALQAGGRLVYVEAPVRLTGALYSEAELRAIAELAERFGAGLIVDQGLAVWADGQSPAAILAAAGFNRLALIGELVPGLGLESWQVGYIAADTAWVPLMQSQKQIHMICTSTPSQYAALAAMEGAADSWAATRAALQDRATEARATAEALGLRPIAGECASVLAIRPPDAEQFCARAASLGYQVSDGAAFHAPGTVRLAIATRSSLATILSAVVEGRA